MQPSRSATWGVVLGGGGLGGWVVCDMRDARVGRDGGGRRRRVGGPGGGRGDGGCVLQLLYSPAPFVYVCVYCLLVSLLTYLEDVRAGLGVLGEGHVGQGVEPQLAAGRVQKPACMGVCVVGVISS